MGRGDAERPIRRRRARVATRWPITREDVATLTRAAGEYLADHSKIAGVMVETWAFPGFASVGAFADYARFIADPRPRPASCIARERSETVRRERYNWALNRV